MPRSILHVDMDQFYAAVEIHRHPELKGKPVIIGSDPMGGKGRGVVSTASYEARAFGVRSALPISTAWKLCPQGKFLPVDMPAYVEVSDKIHEVFASMTPEVEPLSLDEAFLDVSASGLLFGDGEAAGRHVKAEILRRTGLIASVGVASNKFVAKVASDLRKPDALVVVPPGTEAEFLAPLPIGRIWGVGKVSEAQFRKLGIRMIGDLLKIPKSQLVASFGGAYSDHVLSLAQGLDERPVLSEHRAKSVGRECTFDDDSRDETVLRQTLADLCEDVAGRLRRHGWTAGQITLKYRWQGFETHTSQRALRPPSAHGPALYGVAAELLRAALATDVRPLRLLGLSAGKIVDADGVEQEELFGRSGVKRRALDTAMDKVNERFGQEALKRGNQSLEGSKRTRTGFSPD